MGLGLLHIDDYRHVLEVIDDCIDIIKRDTVDKGLVKSLIVVDKVLMVVDKGIDEINRLNSC